MADLNILLERAKGQGCEEILTSFRREYLEAALTKQATMASNKNLTAQESAAKTFGFLKAAVRALEKSNELHKNI